MCIRDRLKYWQDRTLVGFNTDTTNLLEFTKNTSPKYGFDLKDFTATPSSGGSIQIIKAGDTSGVGIDTALTGSTLSLNNKTYNWSRVYKWSGESRGSKAHWKHSLCRS